jgi:hypothetical protein
MAQNEVAKVEVNVASVASLGTIFFQSGYFRDVRDQSQAVVKILYGRELGFSPVASMMGIHIIEGKPSLSSNLLGALVKRCGKYDYRVKEGSDQSVTLEFFAIENGKRESLGFSTFTIEDAKRANLVKPGGGWAKYPQAMLFARALSAGVRLHCPDVSACPLYVPEELGAQVNEEGDVTELPKSARAVEVTTEAIEIGGQSHPATTEGKGSVKPPEIHAEPVMACIESGQAANLHKLFRDALKPANRKQSEDLLHAWLKAQGIIGAAGEGSALRILKANFYEVREAAITYAAGLE